MSDDFNSVVGLDLKPVQSSNQPLPKIAVCLAAFNGREWLREQLDSILVQKNVVVTVFVSVDRSNDGTEFWVNEFSKIDKRVIQLPQGFQFGGAAANFFRLLNDVYFAAFDYVSLADQDDVWYPDKLWRAVMSLSESGSDCYSSNVLAFWDDGKERLIDKAQSQTDLDFLFEAAGPGCTYVLKRAVVEDFKLLLVSHSSEIAKVGLHDWFIYAFARSRGYHWIIDPRPSMAYRQHAFNQVGVNAGWRAYLARAKKIVGGWGIAQARLIVLLTGLESDPFCKPWRRPGRLGMLWLALNAYRARRKVSDRFIFAAACLLLAIVGDRSNE